MIGALIILLPPLLAIYAMIMRSKNKKQGQVGFVYNGKIWVTWVGLIAVLGGLFMIFGTPLIVKKGDLSYRPDWEYITITILAIIEYISYVLVAYRPATAEEIEEAKASGKGAIKMTASAGTSMFAGILACLGISVASIPALLYNALNPVQAIKVIGGVTYKVIGTGFSSVVGGFIGIGILLAIIAFILIMASQFAVLLGTFALGVIAIVKFIKNIKESKQAQ
jgi:hypothetical protein